MDRLRKNKKPPRATTAKAKKEKTGFNGDQTAAPKMASAAATTTTASAISARADSRATGRGATAEAESESRPQAQKSQNIARAILILGEAAHAPFDESGVDDDGLGAMVFGVERNLFEQPLHNRV